MSGQGMDRQSQIVRQEPYPVPVAARPSALANGHDNDNGAMGRPREDILTPPVDADILHSIWRQRLVVAATTAVIVALAIVYLVLATPQYTSTIKLFIEQRGDILSGNASGNRSDSYLNTQCAMLASWPVLSKVIDKPGVRDMKTFADVNPADLFEAMQRRIDADVSKDDDLVSLSFTSPHREEAASVAAAIADAYIVYQYEHKKSSARDTAAALREAKAGRDEELANRLKAMLDFKQANGVLSFEDDRGNIITQRLAKLSEALTTAQLATMEAKAAYDTAKAAVDSPAKLAQFIEVQRAKASFNSVDREDGDLKNQLSQLRLRLASTKGQYAEGHPHVRSANAAVVELEAQIARRDTAFARAVVAALGEAYEKSLANERGIKETFERQQSEALDLNTKAGQYKKLESEYEQTRRLCEVLDERLKEVSIGEKLGAYDVTVVEPARVPVAASTPNKTRTLGAALAIGGVLGMLLGLLRDRFDSRLRSPEEVTNAVGMPLVGLVPQFTPNLLERRGPEAHLQQMSDLAEAYRNVRTTVFFQGKGCTLLVTSPNSGDGKSTFSKGLAIAIAEAGHKVLLIDADLRKPSQHRTLEGETVVGLSDVLNSAQPIGSAIRSTRTTNLWVLPAGPIPRNPSEILGTSAFSSLLRRLAGQYDHVIIDSPPVMAVTDARILAAVCDQTILVVRAGVSTRQDAEHTRDAILSVGGKMLGVVVNGVRRGNRYGYYGGYGYSDFSGKGVVKGKNGNGNGSGNGNGNGNGNAAENVASSAGPRPRRPATPQDAELQALQNDFGVAAQDMGFDPAPSETAPGK